MSAEAPGLGADFDDEVQELERRLVEHPNSGARYGPGTRRALLSSFPFALIYQAEASEVLIVAVAHQRPRPDYWTDRLG